MPKDTHRTATTDHTQLELPEQVTLALAELAGAAREGLLALAVGTGLQVLQTLMAEDVARLVGAKGRHNPDRTAVRHGTDPGQVTLGGRRVRIRRPRVRSADGTGELPVPTYQAFAATDLLGQLALERMLAKLSTRRYPAGLEPVGGQVERAASGTSRSAVSRRFVARTEHVLFFVGCGLCGGCMLEVALLVRARPRTPPSSVSCWSGCASVALRSPGHPGGDRRRQGAAPRCHRGVRPSRHPARQLHKLRNVCDRLPDAVASTVAKRMRRAYTMPTPGGPGRAGGAGAGAGPFPPRCRRVASGRAGRDSHDRQAGRAATLARTLRSTNCIWVLLLAAGSRDRRANGRSSVAGPDSESDWSSTRMPSNSRCRATPPGTRRSAAWLERSLGPQPRSAGPRSPRAATGSSAEATGGLAWRDADGVAGIDAHSRCSAVAVLDGRGGRCAVASFATSPEGLTEALALLDSFAFAIGRSGWRARPDLAAMSPRPWSRPATTSARSGQPHR